MKSVQKKSNFNVYGKDGLFERNINFKIIFTYHRSKKGERERENEKKKPDMISFCSVPDAAAGLMVTTP